MGLFDFLKRKPKQEKLRYVPTQSGFSPIFSDFGENIYGSDIIVQAISCKATEFKKLNPRHIRLFNGQQQVITTSSIAKLLKEPNEYMTQSDFLEKITILLELNKNVFIYPTYKKANPYSDDKIYTGLYPLKPNNVEYLEDLSGKLFIRFTFGNGYQTTLPANEVIHWRKDYGIDDFFGGNPLGTNSDRQRLKMLKEYDKLTQSIAVALNVAMKINGIVKSNTYMATEEQLKQQEEFNNRLANNESGILFTDLKSEYVNIPRDIKLVDKDTLQWFYDTILITTGTPLAILKGDYTKAQKEAWYEHSLEADIKSLGEAFSKVIFSEGEKNHGNKILFYPNAIVFMSMENKLSALQIGLPAGIFVKDEARELLGYPPLPNGQGQVIAQGYNSLLDENNNNKLSNKNKDEGGVDDGNEKQEPANEEEQ